MCCSFVSGILIALVVYSISEMCKFTALTMIAIVIALSFTVSAIILHCSPKNETSVQCRAEADQIKSMYSLYTGSGILSILPNVAGNETKNLIEPLVFATALFIVSGIVAQQYRELCEQKYEKEEQQENEQQQLLQELVEHLKRLDVQKTETTNEEQSSTNPQKSNTAPLTSVKILNLKSNEKTYNVEITEKKYKNQQRRERSAQRRGARNK